jgi:multidrug efflux pump subunit AcrB
VIINLLDRIKSTPGVGDASLWGPQDYAMRAWVSTDRLTGLNLTTQDIINAIQNVQAAVGRVGARPISNDQQLQFNIQTKGRLSSVADFENIVVRPCCVESPHDRHRVINDRDIWLCFDRLVDRLFAVAGLRNYAPA